MFIWKAFVHDDTVLKVVHAVRFLYLYQEDSSSAEVHILWYDF